MGRLPRGPGTSFQSYCEKRRAKCDFLERRSTSRRNFPLNRSAAGAIALRYHLERHDSSRPGQFFSQFHPRVEPVSLWKQLRRSELRADRVCLGGITTAHQNGNSRREKRCPRRGNGELGRSAPEFSNSLIFSLSSL